VFDAENKVITYRDYVDISIAVSSPSGLVVPVLRNCEDMSFAGVESAIGQLGAKAKNGQISMEDMTGGNFTISNGGVFGSLMGTPIINGAQSSILGMHGIFKRPIVVDGKVEIRPMMYVPIPTASNLFFFHL
jgi:2-oxoglutarate dehydrogenase E2 component (dihydrolipoamide succinyltransferase)